MILVDAHVHFHDCFDLQIFLGATLTNFRAESSRCGQGDSFTAFLLLTETARENWFEHLAGYARDGREIESKTFGTWTFHRTDEGCSLWAQCDGGQGFYLISGRQIVTAEDLEVLALITGRQFADGHPLEEVLQSVKETGAIPVIPWGFGKWTGKRGRLLKRVLEDGEHWRFFLGDNSGRPVFLPRPSHLVLAESKGIRVLPGSDPLPFASECWRPGSFGFSVEGSITSGEPARDIRGILLDCSNHIRPYGSLEKPYRFFRNQLAIQIKKQLRKRKLTCL